ncbi:MAG: POTRA domain-containing protein, partial [Microcoleaceae cyanobacterium]
MMHSPRKLSIFTLPLFSLTLMGVQGAIAQSRPSASDILQSTINPSSPQNVSSKTDKSESVQSVSAETEKGRGKRAEVKDFQSIKIAPFNPVFLQDNQENFHQNAQSLGGKLQVSNAQGLSSPEFEGSSVAEVIIRFVNKQGSSVDKNGKPIKNRVPEDFVRRELKLKTGDRYQSAIVRRDIQQLYQLGLFDNVTVSLEQNGIDVNVIYNIQEASASSIGLGAGYNEDLGVYVSLKYTNRTVGSLPQRFSVFVEPSARDFIFDLQFISPYTAAND